MKRIRCPKCENYLTFDETKYEEGQSLVFECVHCGAKGHADRVACLNLLCRVHDPRFRSRMSKERVLALELDEHAKECARRGTTPHKYEPRQRKKQATPNEATLKD